MPCDDLLIKHAEKWERAVKHTFLEECRDGTIGENQFDTWLVQDYLFVQSFVPFAALLLSKAPAEHFDVLLSGLAALRDELQWFQATAKERGLTLDVQPLEACRCYQQFMRNFEKQPYAVHAVAFFAIERAYNEAWAGHSPMKEPYHSFGQRWGSPEFGEYVRALQAQADEALAGAPQGQRDEAEVALLEVCELEQGFWDMASASTTYE